MSPEFDVVRSDLAARFPSAPPLQAAVIDSVARMGALLAAVERRAGGDWPVARARAFCGLTHRLVRGLHMLGTDRVGGTLAEWCAARAVVTADALLASDVPEGSA